ncbi:MATE efflux family protein [Massarina eburnea CBS 473.64]|uniref:MATE efflux family protein n=1 Tax=Massarina eburnea CBS 473.64 TaxID=1395130 RepID=A0A6A6SFN2_9PLEO|nr:MATE efflux family protein [Massarina eburnea CBS 473.64]
MRPPSHTDTPPGALSDIMSQAEHLSPSLSIAEQAIAQDYAEDPSPFEPSDSESESESDSDVSLATQQYSLINSYRRPSYVNAGARSTAIFSSSMPSQSHFPDGHRHTYLSKQEREMVRNEERSLLRDNNLLPPKHLRRGSDGESLLSAEGLPTRLSSSALRKTMSANHDEGLRDDEPSERTSLLARGDSTLPYQGLDTPENISQKWTSAVAAGKITTTWQRESKVLLKSSGPLILTFLLQYSLPVASIFTVGHIGKIELGAVSLASMTASITGYAVYQGLATSLDTLCAQAYGSGRKHLVGLHLQRMLYFLLLITIPISIVWAFGPFILALIVPEQETARLAGLYLRILIAGAPGYAAFESGKRYLQAQGLFKANMYVLLICAPLNAFMNYLFVWRLGWGFIGAPIAVSITENLMPLLLFLYVRFIDGHQCWGGFERRALKHWGPMIRLSLPGLVMVLAEFLAFEILTLSSSWLGPTPLAAQSVLGSITGITFQIPFPMSVAASTRIANLIGATLAMPARSAAKVALFFSILVGIFNLLVLSLLRDYIPRLFTPDEEVIDLVAKLLPLCAAFQLFDALAANCNGILRGLGRQEIGGYVGLFAYYVVGLPISFGMGFGGGWGLFGLWTGPAIALGIVAAIETVYIYKTDWEKAVQAAEARNAMDERRV